jgi:hypothetical protein
MEMTSPTKPQGQLSSESLSSWLPQSNTGEHGLKISFLSAAPTRFKRTFIQPDVTDNDGGQSAGVCINMFGIYLA